MTDRILIPVLLIHGYGRKPNDWTDEGFIEFLVEQGGLEPTLIHQFHYGYDSHGNYDSRGNIPSIAERLVKQAASAATDLDSQVVRLSEASAAIGGPEQVALVAHGMGGIVARYYLYRWHAGDWDAQYGQRVSRLIEIAVPNLGLDALRFFRLLPPDSWVWKLLSWIDRRPFWGRPARALKELETGFQRMQMLARDEAFAVKSSGAWELGNPALVQLAPGSALLAEINRPECMPIGVAYDAIFGDIRVALEINFWGRRLLRQEVALGDLLVPVESASTIPGSQVQSFPILEEIQLALSLNKKDPPANRQAKALMETLPQAFHNNLCRSSAVQAQVLTILRDGYRNAPPPATPQEDQA